MKNPFATRFATVKFVCKKHGVIFTIPFSEYDSLLRLGRCTYCGKTGAMEADKVVPNLGYASGNVVPACRRCNRLKSDATPAELRSIADTIDRLTGR